MPTQPERLATLEAKVAALEQGSPIGWKLFALVVSGAVMWLGGLSFNLYGIAQRISHIEGKVGDPLSATIKGLESSPSTSALTANLDLLSAQVSLDQVNRKRANPENVQKLVATVRAVATKNPDLPSAWKAVATLATYRSLGDQTTADLRPDCHIDQKAHEISPQEVPDVKERIPINSGYVFRNCTLHLDHLPAGQLVSTQLAAPFKSPSGFPFEAGDKVVSGYLALLIDCDIVMNDSGVAQSGIFMFEAIDCKFHYKISQQPSSQAQKLLLASLDSSKPGDFQASGL